MKPERVLSTVILLAVLTITAGCEEAVEVKAYIGKPAQTITFMSSWCPCSNESIPLLKKIHAEYADEDIDFLMLGIQDPESKFNQFVLEHDLPFPAAYDDNDFIARTYGINTPPTTVFIDKEGKLQRVFYGNIKDMETDVYKWVEELL